jgi:uncharacterized protein
MKNINNILKEVEKKNNVKILYACERGSRAWGFPSPDSDYDVRFIYMHERDWYLSLSQQKDTIDFMDGDLDLTGWDLKKSLLLLRKSNAALIERFQSPIEYHAVNGVKEDFRTLIRKYYSPTAVFYHHYSLANKFWEEIKDAENYKLKTWFYLVRSLLSCCWMFNSKTVLPMNIKDLMKYLGEEWKGRINKMIELKKTVGEKYLHPCDDKFDRWIFSLMIMLEESKDNLKVNTTDISYLNKYFLKMLNERADNR